MSITADARQILNGARTVVTGDSRRLRAVVREVRSTDYVTKAWQTVGREMSRASREFKENSSK